jgi:hypothetical protein
MKTVTRGIKILNLIWVFFFVFFFLVGAPGWARDDSGQWMAQKLRSLVDCRHPRTEIAISEA